MSSLLELAFLQHCWHSLARHGTGDVTCALRLLRYGENTVKSFFLPQCLPSAEAHILYYSQPESYKIILHFLRGRIGLWIGPRGTHTSLVLFFKAKVWKWRKERGRLIICTLSFTKSIESCWASAPSWTFLDSKFQWSSSEIYVVHEAYKSSRQFIFFSEQKNKKSANNQQDF